MAEKGLFTVDITLTQPPIIPHARCDRTPPHVASQLSPLYSPPPSSLAAASRAHVRPVDSSAYPPAQPETLSKLARESANDLTVYRHALQLLECRLLHCASSADGGASGRGGRCARTRARGAARLQQAARRGGRGATAARNSAAARLLGGGEYNGESWLAA